VTDHPITPEAADSGPLPADIKGRRAVVTGAGHGIGLAIANHLIMAEARVVAIDKDKEALERNFNGAPGCSWVVDDIARSDIADLAEEVLEHGPVELIVNNLGISTEHGFFDLDEREFDQVFQTNLRGPLFLTRRLVRELIQRNVRGAILFISSLHDTFVAQRPHYSASKAGVAMLCRELAHELGTRGIRVNAISPGWIRTAEDLDTPEQRAKYQLTQPRIPLRRPGEPDDVAKLALLLLSDAWTGYITGANIPVDGGLSLFSWIQRPND
jgi:NAD(P)-dependent dehydrogenase (short-subunit alcohol dehydrogenase family)